VSVKNLTVAGESELPGSFHLRTIERRPVGVGFSVRAAVGSMVERRRKLVVIACDSCRVPKQRESVWTP
jgi:hypothetical protein